MTAPATSSEVCPLCGRAVAAEMARCEACGSDLAGVGGRPLLSRSVLWWSAMGFLAVWLITLAVVAIVR
jgi:hypothetical protein